MADTVSGTVSIAADSTINIRPSTTDEEWIIHNIYTSLGNLIEIYRWNDTGTTSQILIAKTSSTLSAVYYHCTTTGYLIIKNKSGSTIYVGYDGVIL